VVFLEILLYVDDPEASTLTHGLGLCFALYLSEVGKVFSLSAMTALNFQAGIRLKGAFSLYAYKKVISLRGHTAVTIGEV